MIRLKKSKEEARVLFRLNIIATVIIIKYPITAIKVIPRVLYGFCKADTKTGLLINISYILFKINTLFIIPS